MCNTGGDLYKMKKIFEIDLYMHLYQMIIVGNCYKRSKAVLQLK
jgi:hypothetical protein